MVFFILEFRHLIVVYFTTFVNSTSIVMGFPFFLNLIPFGLHQATRLRGERRHCDFLSNHIENGWGRTCNL
jgi:hypothetical protein